MKVQHRKVNEATQWLGKDTILPDSVTVNMFLGTYCICPECGESLTKHGYILDAAGRNIVCPNDWIVVEEYDENQIMIQIYNEELFQLLYEESE